MKTKKECHLSRFRTRHIESHEAPKFFAALNAEADVDFRDFVYLALQTGAPRHDLETMQWDEVILSADPPLWAIPGKLTIPLIPNAIDILKRRAKAANGNPSVFRFPARFRSQWQRFIVRAEIPDLRFHDLRRTFATRMIESGASAAEVMKALGHRDGSLWHRLKKYQVVA